MSTKAKNLLTLGFAFAAGWSDVICFRRYESFAALMTGNTVKAGIASATESDERVMNVIYYLCLVFSYIFGGLIFEGVKSYKPKRIGFILAPLCLVLNILSDVLFKFGGNNRWQVCLLTPTFGIQNSLTFGGSMATNTTIITGNSQKMSQFLYLFFVRKLTVAKAKEFIAPFFAIVSTLLAACLGAFILIDVKKMDAAWLFLPSGVVQAAMMVMHDVAFAEPALRLRPPLIDATKGPAASSSQVSVSGAAPDVLPSVPASVADREACAVENSTGAAAV